MADHRDRSLRRRPRAHHLRRPARLVGRRPRRLLVGGRVRPGRDLADAAAAAPGRRVDAGGGVVPGRRAQLRRAGAGGRGGAARRGRGRRPQPDPRPVRADVGRALRPGGPGRGRPPSPRRGPRRRVAAFAPNIPETLVAFLATASLGAIWSSCAPEFGTRAVIDRLSQIEPVVLVAVDGYRYGDQGRRPPGRGRRGGRRPAVGAPRRGASPYLDPDGPDGWSELLAGPDPGPPTFEAVPFDHPLYVLFSSGTTGLPEADRARPRRHHRSST